MFSFYFLVLFFVGEDGIEWYGYVSGKGLASLLLDLHFIQQT